MAQKMSTKKKVSAVVAGVLVVALAIGGAYAWTDYGQHALNIFNIHAEPDVLLHDDFNRKNKDVYVENTGNTEVFVRVKFAEYLQIGNDSILNAFGMTDGTKADPNDKTTWPVHQFKDAAVNNVCDFDSHTYFEWNMSGEQKEYLAGVTEADGNGYAGLSKTQFDSYNVGDAVPLGDGITTYKRETAEKTDIIMLSKWYELVNSGVAYDDMTTENQAVWDAIEKGCWLLDTDGWAYWSAALAPGTATNLLLDSVTPTNTSFYDNGTYRIDVQLQAATRNEMDRWALDGEAAIADPDNDIATVTETGGKFIEWRSGEETKEWEEIGTTNVFREVTVSIVGTKTPTGNYVVAGHDQDPYTSADNNMLAGRSLEDLGGIALNIDSVSSTAPTQYTITGVDDDFYVTAGMDGKLGTYDDVIRSTSGALGQYDIDTNASTVENIGWNYLYGPLDNMLVATEYVLDNVKYRDDVTSASNTNAYLYRYADSKLKTVMDNLWDDLGSNMAVTVNMVGGADNYLDMSAAQHTGDYVFVCVEDHTHDTTTDNCTTFQLGKYSTLAETEGDLDLGDTKFFPLSLTEIITAYGDSSDPIMSRAALYASKWTANTATNVTVGNNTVVISGYWLRSPGYIGSRMGIVGTGGYLGARNHVFYGNVGTRPACYLNLAAS